MPLHKQQSGSTVHKTRFAKSLRRTPLIPGGPRTHHLAILSNIVSTPDPTDSTHQAILVVGYAQMRQAPQRVDPNALQTHLTASSHNSVNVLLRAVTPVPRQHGCTSAVQERTPVVLGLDPDAIEKTMKIAKNFEQYGIDVRITQHEGKDFGDMSKEEVNYYIQSAQKYELTDRIGYLIQSISSGSIF